MSDKTTKHEFLLTFSEGYSQFVAEYDDDGDEDRQHSLIAFVNWLVASRNIDVYRDCNKEYFWDEWNHYNG